jgi:UDP-glucose 4-epimerase
MKVAVTGASGYLGRLVVNRLASDPKVVSILGLDIHSPPYESEKFRFEKADVRTADFERLLDGQDALYHLAFVVDPRKGVHPRNFDRVNIDGSLRIFESTVRAGVRRIVFASSNSAYGAHTDNPDIFHEDTPRRPNDDWYYSRAKGRVETFLDGFEKRNPGAVVIRFRPSLIIGPGINNTLGGMFSAKWLVSYQAGLRTNCCWDEDAAEAFRLALYHDESDAFNLAGDGALTTAQFGQILGKRVVHLNHRLAVRVAKALRRLGLVSPGELEWLDVGFRASILISNEKAKQKLGWRPRYDSVGAVQEMGRHLGRIQRPTP